MKNPFGNETDNELKSIYEEMLKAREEGIRPRILDIYIQEVRNNYPLNVAEGWEFTEQLFFEEVARRYFEI